MDWQPAASWDALALRARLLRATRGFFAGLGVLEVQTPLLVATSCPDPNIPGIPVRPSDGRTMYLHTSPEHAMKRLLCAGGPDMYQVCPVFRDGEAGQRHNPEFTMVEWYRHDMDYLDLAAETAALIEVLLDRAIPVDRTTYRDAFLSGAGVDPLTGDEAAVRDACRRAAVEVPASATRDDMLDLLLGTVVAAGLDAQKITVVSDYPVSQAALAQVRPDDPPVAERFEVFLAGMELANGFHELTDPREQRRRFVAEQERCRRSGRPVPPLDERLLAALESGLPDCSGVALGFDRVLMLAAGTGRLSDVLAFPYDRS